MSRKGEAGLICLFSARLYKWIKFSLHFTNAESCIVGLRRSLARAFHFLALRARHAKGMPILVKGPPSTILRHKYTKNRKITFFRFSAVKKLLKKVGMDFPITLFASENAGSEF
uniref:Uncharacterized protein n=1 Tax=Candidatus Kentrum sp. SD TaxID=2126332 RepID=A0A450YNE5_9GAMM|nr:MAG: hypothetical protein BECKSD772F_GA0070984_100914 [Candidatus Kentron sp. SD]VFK43074.1 MAG: hypothetical protein BECKSD772E_GA0070983_102214 [Candidatus Kentron sp. SD]VFK77729.1 MAG: hypothetical protein BECKSD772D_GA0070982_100158 [Candidatus Kentron sp. SD]